MMMTGMTMMTGMMMSTSADAAQRGSRARGDRAWRREGCGRGRGLLQQLRRRGQKSVHPPEAVRDRYRAAGYTSPLGERARSRRHLPGMAAIPEPAHAPDGD